MKKLEIRQLSLGYQKKLIIRNLNLEIPLGKITILIGSNGCGKSTLLKGIARLLKPSQGMVYLDGKAITQYSTKTVAQELGILPQSPTAPEGLTVKDLVAQGRYPHQTWWQQWSTEDEHLVEIALATTGMTNLAHRNLDTLSGGQRQRAWIAMALAQNTDILLLDEPTTYLDLAHQVDVLDLLTNLNRNSGKTIVMVLNDLNFASRYGDYLVAMQSGQIYTHGSPETVMTEETIDNVFGLSCRIILDPDTQTPLCVPISSKIPNTEDLVDKKLR